MAEMLELLDWEFKTTVTNVLRAHMKKVDNMQGQTDNISRGAHSEKESNASA